MPAPDEPVTLIRELLLKNPHGLIIREIAKKTGYNRMSVAKYLDILLAQGIVGKRMIGNAKVYYLSRQIPVTTYMEYTSKHYCITDSSLRVVQLNEWVPDTVGMKEEDFINRYLPDTLKGVVVNLGECMAAMENALEGEVTTVIVEEDFMGVHKFFEILHMPVRFPDGSNGMMAVSQEITDRKLVEIALREEGKRFRDLLEGLPVIVFSTDPAGVLTYLSPRAAEYGIIPSEFEGRMFGDLAVPADREAVASALLSANESGAAGGIRFRAALPEGRVVTMVADCMVRYTEAGIPGGTSGILREVPAGGDKGKF